MSPAQQRGLALWTGLLSALVCLLFLPVPRWGAWLILLVTLALIIGGWRIARRGAERNVTSTLDPLPDGAYRQPVVLVCGDLPFVWSQKSPVRVVKQGCWIRVEKTEELQQVARQVLSQRPEWGPQLSVLLCVCPQQHAQSDALTSALLSLRWQLSQLRRQTGYAVPLALQGQVGSAMSPSLLWQAALPGEAVKVWQPSCAPCSVSTWLSVGGAAALQQQVLMNSLMGWFEQHVHAVLTEENTDLPPLTPAAVLWGLGPSLPGSLASSAWTTWLSRHSGLSRVAGWQPGETDIADASSLPDFILPQLPAGRGLTPRGRVWRAALAIFTLAAVAALLSSGWNNRQLLQRVGVDIARYERIAMDDYRPKASAVRVLREDAALLDSWARNGVPLRLSLGLYRGQRIRLPLLEAIRRYVPPPPPPRPVQRAAPDVIRLDSMSLFDTGKWVLKPGSTKRLVNSLVDIKARPGWLIVVAGHTDSVGEEKANQLLSLKRAETVLLPSAASLNDKWRRSVVANWHTAFDGRFPFAASKSDASLPMLAEFVRKDSGRIERFLTTELNGVLHKEGSQWVPDKVNSHGLVFNPAFLRAINQLSQLSDILFTDGSQGISFELQARPAPEVVETQLTIDGQKLRYFNQMTDWQTFRWPGETYKPGTLLTWTTVNAGTRLFGDYSGTWGFIRWLEQGKRQQLERSQWMMSFTAPDGRTLQWVLRSQLGSGPLALLALRGLTLPDQIFTVDAAESAQALTTGVGNSDMDEMEL